jgi:hypothetical protein
MIGTYTSTSPGSTIIQDVSGNTQRASLITLPSTKGTAAFIVKYDSNGKSLWATYLDGSGSFTVDAGISLTSDSSNNIYITGYINGSTVLQDASGNTQRASLITLPIPRGYSAFLIKYDASGIAQWATYLDSSGNNYDTGNTLICDSLNNIYMAGEYTSSGSTVLQDASGITQRASLITLPTTKANAAFLIKYNSDGKSQWATYLDGSGNSTSDIGYALTCDSLNNIYMAGRYISIEKLSVIDASGNTQKLSSYTLPESYLGRSAFLIKYG